MGKRQAKKNAASRKPIFKSESKRSSEQRWYLIHSDVDLSKARFNAKTAAAAAKKAYRAYKQLETFVIVAEKDIHSCSNPYYFNASDFSFQDVKKPASKHRGEREDRSGYMNGEDW